MPRPAVQRPLTLYADEIQFHPDITSTLEPAIRSIDVEINRVQAEQILQKLQAIVEEKSYSSIRIRFTGRMMQ